MRNVSDLAVEAVGLRKRYGDVVALDGLDLAIPRGTVLGLLGRTAPARPPRCRS